MKIVRVEAIQLDDGSHKLFYNNNVGVIPEFPNTFNEYGQDLGIGKVSEDAFYYHHIDRNETRYLIYLKGAVGRLNGNEVYDLENSLDKLLINGRFKN
ncbi:hypothetical protein ACT4WM_06110 [Acinetobacter baumannii]|uniref:hypothetical protein n=1 Tax=Acinetobacter calcoaceticus/baumannii complex TaxID=909768 RepID=UPI00066769ED|nr:hypothetical protein [Acinetobacter baumannii]EKV1723910.1 hypothetical protein [Acinetobacter baumannii]MDC4851440.1 hypothetical protein [Acinetobacter baumannii]MDC4957998.1 hypothetical protein [Acinetobacter baumannii]MDC5366715.1 hypothetical protein [Acinetobacter baumannii]MDC5398465.1 hypothetical protein [Acinetobacter baumannii]